MKIRSNLNALFLLVLLGAATAADAQVQPQLAQRYFEEATTLCERDAGRLWGVSLCGPLVIVDQATGTRATSQPEPEGPPPRFPGLVDGPVSWGGLRWFSMPLYMLPENDADLRQQLLLHGLFHRIQPELGFMTEDGFNEHLDTLEGRVWMQLEWRALRRAIESSGSDGPRRSPMRWPSARTPPPVSGAADNERRDESRRACLLHRHRGLGEFACGCPPSRSVSARGVEASCPSSETSKAHRDRLTVCCWTIPAGMARQVVALRTLATCSALINRPATTDVAVATARYDAATLRTAEEARDWAHQVASPSCVDALLMGPC